MGTTYNVKFFSETEQPIEQIQQRIEQRLFEINKLMSTYDPESELSRFNQSRFTTPIEMSDETVLVLNEALRLGELSGGVLDVTVGPLVNLWGFGPTQRPEKTPSEEEVQAIRAFVGLDKLRITGNQVTKLHPMLYVDLSTIAKGYGVDELANIMASYGIDNYLVEIGGEMRVKGLKPNGEAWRIAIEKPVVNERAIQRVVSVGDNALATSGDYRNYYEEDGVRFSHLIDPTTGKPIQHNTVSVTVIHPSSMTADGLATAFNVMGWEKAVQLADEHNLAVLIIRKTPEGFEEFESSAFKATVTTY
ncbi:FAD:protein FMN transferase [Alteromonas sediminis]|uniref:FAD:protein FMN transferase n=2 Tax=Alteromonas sediminis TaxID=2259342 RepID=A0A3N5YMU5_9ALTE|nr:FAD:protein FMN transferase [Alteromonas sediminis]